jgi:hypothetical protein
VRTFYKQKRLTEAEDAALLQTEDIKQNGLEHEGLGLLILKFYAYVVVSSGFIKFTCE